MMIPPLSVWRRDDWILPCHVQDPAGQAVNLTGTIVGAELWLAGYKVFTPLTVDNGGIVRVADAFGDFRVEVSRLLTANALPEIALDDPDDRTRVLIYFINTLGKRKAAGTVVFDVFDVADPRAIDAAAGITLVSQNPSFTIVMPAGQGAPGPSNIPAAQISDSTATGQALVKAPSAAAVRQTLGVMAPVRHAVNDTNVAVQPTDTYVGFSALTAPRTVTLPQASAYPAGHPLFIADETGACSTDTPIIVAAAGGDTIQGQPSFTLASPFQKIAVNSNGANLWTV